VTLTRMGLRSVKKTGCLTKDKTRKREKRGDTRATKNPCSGSLYVLLSNERDQGRTHLVHRGRINRGHREDEISRRGGETREKLELQKSPSIDIKI